MTNKLVVIINSLKVPKIKKILLYEMKFLVPNYSYLQNTWLGGYRSQIPVLSVLNWICRPPPWTIPGYATGSHYTEAAVAPHLLIILHTALSLTRMQYCYFRLPPRCEICALLGCYSTCSGKSLPTFQGNMSDPFSGVKKSKKKILS